MRSLRLLIVGAIVDRAQPAAAAAVAPRSPHPSRPSAVDVAEPGWPRPPGASGFDPVPAISLKHLGTP